MSELKIGTAVRLFNGTTAKVKKLLGEGGQGFVYLVEVNGREMALKWYKGAPSKEPNKFYENLRRNAQNGAPSPTFLWPEQVTMHERGSFGYIMKLRPQGYYEFGQYILNHQRFGSWQAMLTAAIEICEGFKALHAQGLSYQDLNDGNFFINPQSGHVLICDNDNAFPNGEKSGILGKARYMAPEVVMGKRLPDAYSDKFSLSVMLFLLFYMDHPFEGMRNLSHACMTEKYDRICFGSDILFIADPKNKSNAPVKGVHNNVIRKWPLLPQLLRDTFISQFCKPVIDHPNKRMTELQWLDVLTRVRDMVVICPHCRKETFIDGTTNHQHCLECGQQFTIDNTLEIDNRSIPLTDYNRIYIDRDSMADLLVLHERQNPNLLDIQNLTQAPITVTTPSGKVIPIGNEEFFPVKVGLQLSITVNGNVYKATIK